MVMSLLITLLTMNLIRYTKPTIDLNSAELQYLADHLTIEECRRLVAAAHFKFYQEPNSLDQAERKISKDLSCIEQLHHWNSEPGEGKGETHEVLEHRLRQMGKYGLADWLGRTVFHELALDLNRSIESGFRELASEKTSEIDILGPTLVPIIQDSDHTPWFSIDIFLYSLMLGLLLTTAALGVGLMYAGICNWWRKRQSRMKYKQHKTYDLLEGETSDSESEDRFDLRDHTVRIDSITEGTNA
ncbi:hypothetical protein JTB14_009712 [Gonioctena quinquepunctata]|nr:hypothetical protein JTB14_009712 [Gonioctena quinquepunctata]